MNVPKLVFIVPYRDRVQHKQFFTKYMDFLMEDYEKEDYEIFFIHQCDNRPFNRGAMKNIGFLAIKDKYPNDYKNITFVFNDVDTLPYTKNLLPYETKHGVVKHFYGVTFALGGIFSISGSDFEKINGFPNLWGWSQEDNLIQYRAINGGLKIDRSVFFPILDSNILQFTDSIHKIISKKEILQTQRGYIHGLKSLHNIKMTYDNEYINIQNFTSETSHNDKAYTNHNISEKGGRIQLKQNRGGHSMSNMRFI